MSEEKKVGNQRFLSPRVQVEFTYADAPYPQVEIVEEETEKSATPLVERAKALTPKTTPRGDSIRGGADLP